MLILFASGLVWVYLYVESSGDPVVDSSTGYVTFEKTDILNVSLTHNYVKRECGNVPPSVRLSGMLKTFGTFVYS